MKRSSSPHIYTVTGNLLWEQTLTFADWAPGRGQRASKESFQVGGKGINVSKMLTRLGAANTALCFTGGFSGAACAAWLGAGKFDFRAFPSAGATRAGMVVRGGGHRETTFLGPDASPGPAAVRACAAWLKTRPDGGVLAICGSLPGWETADFDPLRAALESWMSRGTIVADTYGAPLQWFAERPAELIKINQTEFEGLRRGQAANVVIGQPDDNIRSLTPSALRAARHRWPVRAWVVTNGGGAVSLIDEAGKTNALMPPRVREVSATGSGDVLLACMLHARLHLGMSLRAAVAYALPYAAANAADPGIAEFPDRTVST